MRPKKLYEPMFLKDATEHLVAAEVARPPEHGEPPRPAQPSDSAYVAVVREPHFWR